MSGSSSVVQLSVESNFTGFPDICEFIATYFVNTFKFP